MSFCYFKLIFLLFLTDSLKLSCPFWETFLFRSVKKLSVLENRNRAQRYKIILKRQHFKSKKSLKCIISCFHVKKTIKGEVLSRDSPSPFPNLYNNTRILTYVYVKREFSFIVHPMTSAFACSPSIESFGIFSEKGWSSDFPPPRSAFSGKRPMAFQLRGHNGVHCCGTVGDSHSSSQLSTAKCTFTGDSFLNHAAKVRKKIEISKSYIY